MGKSLGNYIGVAEPAGNQFGKIMSVPDVPMRQYFTLLTELPFQEVESPAGARRQPEGRQGKCWARASWAQYHGESAADQAAAEFRRRSSGEDPDNVPDVVLASNKLDAGGRIPAPNLIKELGLESSTSNARRVIEQGGFNVGSGRVVRRLMTSRH